MNKFFQILIVLTALAPAVSAQVTSNIPYHQHFAELYVVGGGQFVNFSGLNSRLQKTGIDKLKAGMAGAGAGLAFNVRRVTAGVDASFMQGYQQDVSATSSNGHIYVGYNVLRAKSWTLAPEAGIAYQYITLNITKPSAAVNFNEALTNVQNQVELRHHTTLLDVALAFKARSFSPFFGRLGIKPACKFGYRYGLGDNTWEVRRSSVTDGPKDRASNFYLSLLLVFGHVLG